MKYCAEITLKNFYKWDHGFNPCFIDTLSSLSVLIFINIFGWLQIRKYKKYSTVLEYWERPHTRLFTFQKCLIVMVVILHIIRIFIDYFLDFPPIDGVRKFYVYALVVGICNIWSWSMCYYLIRLERGRSLPGIPARGHGLVLILFWAFCLFWENLSFINWSHELWWWNGRTLADKIELSIFVLRYLVTNTLFFIGIKAPALYSIPSFNNRLHNFFNTAHITNTNLSANANSNHSPLHSSTWKDLRLKAKLIGPYLWPAGQRRLQFYIVCCAIVVLAGRFINVLLPITYKNIINMLTKREFCWKTILLFIFLQSLQGLGIGGSGLLSNFRSFLWISIQQYSTKRLEVDVYRHILSLPLQWHISKKTGEVLRILERGTQSIDTILNYVSFSIGPTLIDIIIAIVYLATVFGSYYSAIIFLTIVCYIAITIVITEWRTKHRRSMNQLDNIISAKATETLFNFETVKYNAAEWFEIEQYARSIKNYQNEEWITSTSLNGLNCIQGLICVWIGLLSGTLLIAKSIGQPSFNSRRTFDVGDFVLYVSYLGQLYIPLNWFGSFYRSIQQSSIDLENLIDLIREKPYDASLSPQQLDRYVHEIEPIDNNDNNLLFPTNSKQQPLNVEPQINVTTSHHPEPFLITKGEIEFSHVSFGYDKNSVGMKSQNSKNMDKTVSPENKKDILYDISFHIPAGHILGIVGLTGAGKSTIIKLLFNLYRPESGKILIDGVDIHESLMSDAITLRRQMGLVPQDVYLFNQTIAYNIDYGTFCNTNATSCNGTNIDKNNVIDNEGSKDSNVQIIEAAKIACIHDTIISSFPKGYETMVGEKGLRLSGGEKQRVGIARVILQSPKIIVLDEATSAMDSLTEARIQKNLAEMCAVKETTQIIIAHRLSTITHANEIIVLDQGRIVERGRHEDLLTIENGKYAEMWYKQLKRPHSQPSTENLLNL